MASNGRCRPTSNWRRCGATTTAANRSRRSSTTSSRAPSTRRPRPTTTRRPASPRRPLAPGRPRPRVLFCADRQARRAAQADESEPCHDAPHARQLRGMLARIAQAASQIDAYYGLSGPTSPGGSPTRAAGSARRATARTTHAVRRWRSRMTAEAPKEASRRRSPDCGERTVSPAVRPRRSDPRRVPAGTIQCESTCDAAWLYLPMHDERALRQHQIRAGRGRRKAIACAASASPGLHAPTVGGRMARASVARGDRRGVSHPPGVQHVHRRRGA